MKLTALQRAMLRDLEPGWLHLEFMAPRHRAVVWRLAVKGMATIHNGLATATEYGRAVLDHKS